MNDLNAMLAKCKPRAVERVFVDVYRRENGQLLVHADIDDARALAQCMRVGRAGLDEARWSRRLGCPLRRAHGAVVPREFAAQLISDMLVIG
ncbi:hypothetical protein DWG18_14795 [Lysobacter sp. TY2-98]|uniref:hypothetical protein n=1 Tax=Lysobacter sp. TY2-98 TaxID=2290922 RepID=UPI000E203496|nr:hypothetical protein [Lysobacter sp. TY2-98]AXK73421.1 hypothetical protein DWG18_14795 [Lysobacter sp. TY2-98]